MGISKKRLRTITVNQNKYRWKFNKKVFITSADYPDSLLIVDWGWYDILESSVKEEFPDPLFATPKFVREAIDFAIENNWLDGKLNIGYENKKFYIRT